MDNLMTVAQIEAQYESEWVLLGNEDLDGL